MNLSEQMEPGPGAGGKLADATLEDLIRELKARCTAIVVTMVVDDEDGREATLTRWMGMRVTCIGLLREAEAELIRQGATTGDDE